MTNRQSSAGQAERKSDSGAVRPKFCKTLVATSFAGSFVRSMVAGRDKIDLS